MKRAGMFFFPDSGRTQVWSCGGGRQSMAIAVLIERGDLPKPDVCVMVDTSRERSSTWQQMKLVSDALALIDVRVAVVPKERFASVDVYGGSDGKTILLPGFTTLGGKPGKLTNYCSGEWKRDVISRYLRRELGIVACDQWIGISTDEMRRMRPDRRQWSRNVFPLIDLNISSVACAKIVRDRGWPEPRHSCCWMCPNQSDREWLDMKTNFPDDFARAVEFEREVRKTDAHFYLHKSCKHLDQVEFVMHESLFSAKGCESGFCFV